MASYGKKVGNVYGTVGTNKKKFGGNLGVKVGKNDYQAGFTGNLEKPGLGFYAGKNIESSKPKAVSISVGSVSKNPYYRGAKVAKRKK